MKGKTKTSLSRLIFVVIARDLARDLELSVSPDLVSLITVSAAAVARQPLDGHGERLLPGDGDVAGGVRGGLLHHQHGPGC